MEKVILCQRQKLKICEIRKKHFRNEIAVLEGTGSGSFDLEHYNFKKYFEKTEKNFKIAIDLFYVIEQKDKRF